MAFTYVVGILALLHIAASFPANESEITTSIFDDGVVILNGTSAESATDLLANSSSPNEEAELAAGTKSSTQDDEVPDTIKWTPAQPEDETAITTESSPVPTGLPKPTPTSLAALTRSSAFVSIVPICIGLLLKKLSGHV